MTWAEFLDKISMFTTDNIIDHLVAWDLQHNYWFIGGVILLGIVLHLLGKRAWTALLIGAAGIAVLISYTFQTTGDVATDIAGDRLVLFIGTAVAVVAVMIYLLFIQNE
jgi:peptidoglycan/LPS O-acetylase OafA/YrhL